MKSIQRLLCTIPLMVLTLILVPLAFADYQDGIDACAQADFALAMEHFSTAAQKGDPDAESFLLFLDTYGENAAQHFAQSINNNRNAAAEGDAEAQYNLGMMSFYGHGVAQNYEQALQWFHLAAQQEHAKAQYHLGASYFHGYGCSQDYVQAHMWLSLAAAQGLADAKETRDSLAEVMNPTQLEQAERMREEWHTKE